MNHTNRIKSLHQTDETTAQKIMEQYPAQWDMDKVFQSTYQKYLFRKNESLQDADVPAGECTEALPCADTPRPLHRLRKVGAYAAFAAVYIGLFLFFFRMDGITPPVDHFPDGTHNSNVPHLDVDSNKETMTDSVDSETEPIVTSTVSAEPSETMSGQTTPAVSEAAETGNDIIENTLPMSTDVQIPDPTEVMTAPPVTETEPPAVTGTPEPESTAPETTTTTATTEPPVIPLGHFEVGEQSGSLYQVTYVRENAVPVEEHEHSFAADGFTITGVLEQNPDYDFRSVIYNLEDAAGQHYMVQQFRYDYFMTSFNPEYYPLTRSYMIGGKSVFLIYRDDPEAVCNLMWDDGCHVCVMTSQYKDLAQMELLAQSQITQ